MSRMNAGLILAGQTPDFLGTIGRANEMAARQNEFTRQNELAQLYKQHGAGIAAGNQDSLNALAASDPMAALNVQKQHLGMDATRQGMQINAQELELRKQDAARKAQQWAMGVSAQEAAAKSERIKAGLMSAGAAFQAGNLGEINRILTSVGEQPLQSLDQFPYIAAQYEGVLSALEGASKFGQPEAVKPLSSAGKLAEDLRTGVITEEQYNAANQKSGMRVQTNPDGTMTFEQGVGVTGKPVKTTEGEKSAAGYLSRMRAAEDVLQGINPDGEAVRSLASLLVAGTNFEGLALSDVQSRILQAQRDWVRAKLRKESGAVIGDVEMAEEIRTYFPLPGEGDDVVAQKRAARKEAEKQFVIMSGNAAPNVEDVTPEPSALAPLEPFDPQTPDFSQMSDDELRAYIERGGQ